MKSPSEVSFRKSAPSDLPRLLELADRARLTMRSCGNMNQWINGYPSKEVFENDIAHGHSYVMEESRQVVATFAFIPSPEPTYNKIYQGQWLNEAPYYVIHRIAGSPSRKGCLKEIIDYCFSLTDNIRIDTHRDNVIMRHMLKKLGFTYCGIIYLADGAERLAFQKQRPSTTH